MKKKNLASEAAIAFGSLGGKARAKKLTKEQLSAIGKKGGRPKKQWILDEVANSPKRNARQRARSMDH